MISLLFTGSEFNANVVFLKFIDYCINLCEKRYLEFIVLIPSIAGSH